jgi:hypothetical protein
MGDLSSTTSGGGISIDLTADLSQLGQIAAKGTAVATEQGKKLGEAFAKAFGEAVAHANVSMPSVARATGGGGGATGAAAAAAGGGGASYDATMSYKAHLRASFSDWRDVERQKTQVIAEESRKRDQSMGRTGGASGAGGVGNPFSDRGLARMLGSGAIAYGAQSAINLTTSMVEAHNIATHPERVLRNFQADGTGHDVRNDPFMQGQAQTIAGAQGGLHALQGVESIPLLGSLVKLGDAATGASDHLKDVADAAERAAQAHERAIGYLEGGQQRIAAMSGNPTFEAYATGQRSTDAAYADIGKHPGDPAVVGAYYQAKAESKIALQKAVNEQASDTAVQGDLAKGGRESAEYERTGVMSHQWKAYAYQRTGGRREIEDKYNEQLRVMQAGKDRAGSQDESDEIEKAMKSARAARDAHLGTYDAESAAGGARLTRASRRDDAQMSTAIGGAEAGEKAARSCARNNDTFQAEMVLSSSRGRRGWRRSRTSRGTARSARRSRKKIKAQEDEAVSDPQPRDARARFGLDSARWWPAITGDMPELGACRAHAYGLLDEVKNSSPGAAEADRLTALMELDAYKHRSLGVRGGAIAAGFHAGQVGVIGDPMDWRKRAIERKLMEADFDEARKQHRAGRQRGTEGRLDRSPAPEKVVPTLKDIVDAIRGLMLGHDVSAPPPHSLSLPHANPDTQRSGHSPGLFPRR